MRDRPWAVVRALGPLGYRIDSTHNTRLAASFFAAISTGIVAVHPTEHARCLEKLRDEPVAVFGPNGEIRYVKP